MNKIRVLLANHPMMVPDTIRQLVMEQEDMELVCDVRGPMKILQETGRTKADAVILSHEGKEVPGLCSQLLSVYPDLTIFSIASDLTSAFTQQLCSSRQDFPLVRRQDIAQSLRAAVRHSYSTRNQ